MKSKFKNSVRGWWFVLAVVTALLAGSEFKAHAFIHPCIPTTLQELDTLKASTNQEPWKSGYASLAGGTSTNYTMQGPFATVTRNPDLNLGQWKSDMGAVSSLASMWYFTGNTAYAQKAHDILLAWANTQTSFGGQESGLSLGDYAASYAGGADILRGTWPGWTTADTTAVKNLFLNVYWPATSAPGNAAGPANKGLLNMKAGIAIAAFCDDTNKFNHVIDVYRTYAGAGLVNTLPTGETGETGRDQGHTYVGLLAAAFISEVAWKQGIDLYSELDNRLLACGEYYARNTLATDNPFVPFGSVDWTYYSNTVDAGTYTANRDALYLIQNAYRNRFGLSTPWIDRKLQSQPVDGGNWMYAQTADFTTATPLAAIVRPAVSVASSGLTLTSLGATTNGSSFSYTNGVTTLAGSGWGVWGGTGDSCQFAYQTMTGDCAMVAKVNPFPYTGNTAGRMGLMIRDNLVSTKSQTAIVSLSPQSTGGGYNVESYQTGWTDNWGGSNWAHRSETLPLSVPYWLKIERSGNYLNTYSSPDGANWVPGCCSYYGNLPSTVYIGLFLCTGGTMNATGTYSNLAFTGGSGGLVTTPAAPAAVFAEGSSKTITARWLPSFGATSYNLLRSTTSGSGYAAIASNLSTATTSYVDGSAVAGTTYYYVVQAANSAGTSANSPEFSASLLPAPMVNVAFSGTASSSAIGVPSYEAPGNAFDSNPGSKWYNGNGSNPSPTGWLRYDFGANNAQVVKRYTVNSADVANRNPKDWTFQGSQDGSTWTTLDTQTNQSFADLYRQNIYNIGNTTAYRYYQINVTANNGASTLAISELGLWSDTGHTLQDGRYRLVSRNSNKVMDGGATTNGTPLLQQTYNGGNSQQWDIVWQGNSQYRATAVGSSKVIDNGGTFNAGDNLVIQPWSGGTSQLWKIVPDSDGFIRFTSANSGLVADVNGGSTADGANLIQATYSGADNQLWMPSLGIGTIPPAPAGLTASSASGSQINLSWIASSGATSYNVQRATNSGGNYVTIGSVVGTSFTDITVVTNQTYFYVVTALNSGGESGNSPEASATARPAPALKWTGAASGNWDSTTTNWSLNGSQSVYQDGSSVRFDDTALSNVTINVPATAFPAIMVVSNSSKSYSFSGSDISGAGSLLKLGNGTLTFNAANTYGGGTTLSNGTLIVNNNSALGSGPVTVAGGTFRNGATVTMNNNVSVVTNTTTIWDVQGDNFTFNGNLTGGGTITRGIGATLTLWLGGDNSGFTGTYQDQVNGNAVTRITSASAGSANARWIWNQGTSSRMSLGFGNGTINWGSMTGSGFVQQVAAGTTIIQAGALGLNDTFSGVMQEATPGTTILALTKVGTGTMTLSGANTYSGPNNINAGKLIISTASQAKGVYLVASNATFGVTNTTTGSATISNLIASAGSALEFQRVTNTVTPLIAASNLIVNGSCMVKIIGTNGLKIGTNYPLVSYSGTLSGQFTNLLLQMPGGYGGTLVSNANLVTLSVTSLPGAPANLSATAGDGRVMLAWNTVADATGYNVKSSMTSGGAYTVIATNLPALTFTNTGLVNGAIYYYVVSTLNAGGESTNSTQVSARPVSTVPPTSSVALVGNQLQLTWPADHTGWRLQVNTNLSTTNWQDVAGTEAANSVSIPLTNGNAFFRLVYP